MRKQRLLLLTCGTMCSAVATLSQEIVTVVGGGPNNIPALSAGIVPARVASDPSGNFYFVAGPYSDDYRVFRVDKNSGQLTIYAGGGFEGLGDGGPATSAQLCEPSGMAFDRPGNLFIADSCNNRVRRVDAATQVIATVAGNGSFGFSGDGGPATSAAFNTPIDVAVDGAGNLFIADRFNHRIRRVDAVTKVIVTIAGSADVFAIGLDSVGNLFIVDPGSSRVFRVDAVTNVITTVAGNGTPGFSGDGGPATAAGLAPVSVAADSAGNLFIADASNRIRRVDAATQVITTVAGNGTPGFSGDGGPATAAELDFTNGITIDKSDNVLIADTFNYRVRGVDAATRVITTVAGDGSPVFGGDGYPARSAQVPAPYGIGMDSTGNLFIADGSGRVRRVDAITNVITTVAGNGAPGFSGDGGPATLAAVNPAGLAVDGAGTLLIADSGNERIRRVDANTKVITTVAGNGYHNQYGGGFSGDGGPATSAELNHPVGVAVDTQGAFFIADQSNSRIRRVDAATQVITTVAGSASHWGFGGDGGPATSALLSDPAAVALDGSGNLFIADEHNYRVRRVDAATQVITTVAGNGSYGFSGDGDPATSVALNFPTTVALDRSGNLFFTDWHRIRRVDARTTVITTVAGNGTFGFSGDGGPATSAEISYPFGITVDNRGSLLIADSFNNRVRKVSGVIPPTIVPQVSGAVGKNGWYVSNVTVSWSISDNGSTIVSSSGCNTTVLNADTAGVTLTCTATSAAGLSSSASVTIKIEITPLKISGMPQQPCTIWPPNHKFVQIAAVMAGASVSGLVPASFAVVAMSNEASDPTSPDTVVTPDGSGGFTVQVRAERLGTGNGRVYTIEAKAASNAGNETKATATCTVPHDASGSD